MIIHLLSHLRSSLKWIFLWMVLINNGVFAQNWASSYYRDHSLVGSIWDTEKNAWITHKQLILELLEYDYILLGESHNNVDHHLLQAGILNSLVAAGAKPTVVMEMLAEETWQDQPRTWTDLTVLKEHAIARNKGWPWEIYAPILQSVVHHQLELMAGNIASTTLHEWSNEIGPYTPAEVLTEYWITSKGFNQLKHDIVESHCGYANAAFVQFMARAQLQRDRIMSSALVNSKIPVVLIAGAGHVRNNYAVPMQLLNKHKRLSYVSIAFVPVLPDLLNPMDYLDEIPKVFDILYFTPNHTNQDPCVTFRKKLQKMQQRNLQQ